jgi:hypothetical protein
VGVLSTQEVHTMDDIRERLLQRDYLYADASAYRAGVEAALAALAQQAPSNGPDRPADLATAAR